MATHDYVIDNSTGANVRADLNLVLQAILSNNSSSSAPSTTAAYMWWADTTNGVLKIRNSSDNAWVELLQLDGTLTLEDGSASTPALAFRDDLNTGIFSTAANHVNFATNGVERIDIGTDDIVVNNGGADLDFRIEGNSNANLFKVDAGNDRIGIGTSSPSVELDITGSIVASGTSNALGTTTIKGGSNAAARLLLQNTTSVRTNFIGLSSDDDTIVISADDANQGSNSTIEFKVDGSERMRIDSSGNIAIGTSTTTMNGNGLKIFHTNFPSLQLQNNATGTGASAGAEFILSTGGALQIVQRSSEAIIFKTANTERMRIDSSGQVGIGTSSPATQLEVKHSSDSRITITAGNTFSQAGINFADSSGVDGICTYDHNTRKLHLGAGTSTFTDGDITIDSSGRVAIGDTSSASRLHIESNASTMEPVRINDSNNTNTQTHRISIRTGEVEVGNISATRSATVYNTSSDYRLKENVVSISDGITRLKTLLPKRFNFIIDETNTLVDGFLAHEVTAVPEAISGTKDAVVTQAQVDSGLFEKEELGNPIHQSIDQSKLVPLLVAAVQELITKVETLEAA